MNFNESIKRARKKANLTQKEMAKIAEVNTTTYQQYEYGNCTPNITIIIKIANTLDISLDYLCGRTNNPNNPNINK